VEEPPDYIDPLACNRMEWEILQLLLQRVDDWLWCPIEEVIDQSADPIVALDALAGLCEVGLIRRTGENVMVTTAAVRFDQLITDQPRAEWVRPIA
jgi:hypothetical protein